MEDRFRVRGWSIYDSGYYYDIQNMLFGEEDNMTLLGAISKGLVNEIIPEQCTGCRDYERKLIYTNDILKLNGVPNLYQCIFSTNRVGFDFKPLNTKYKWSDFFDHASDFIDHCKIVGNIHENPELLEGNK